tara:strand:+ start:143 stop:358 length:216 start_codon:yes stop_codon:yes gene_type:complete
VAEAENKEPREDLEADLRAELPEADPRVELPEVDPRVELPEADLREELPEADPKNREVDLLELELERTNFL